MLAVGNGHVETVLYLIASGAIVNAKDVQGRTALHRGVSCSAGVLTEQVFICKMLSFMNRITRKG